MTGVFYGTRRAVETLLWPFDQLPATWGLLAIALVTGVLMVIVVGKVTPQARIRRTRSRIAASIYEIRLFLDSPRRVLAAQGRLLGGAIMYTVYLGPAFILLTLPLGLLYLHLEARYGLAPVAVGDPVVVAVDLDDSFDGYRVQPGELPDGLRVTAPPLVDAERHEVFLRVELDRPGSYALPIRAGDAVVDKRISTEAGLLTPERRRGASVLWSLGLEEPLPDDAPVRAIRVDYRPADETWIGLSMPWWLFWLIASTIGALAVRKPLGVEL
jgi:hypothetical protein